MALKNMLVLRSSAMLLVASLSASTTLLINASKINNQLPYLFITLNFCVEVVKFLICALVLLYKGLALKAIKQFSCWESQPPSNSCNLCSIPVSKNESIENESSLEISDIERDAHNNCQNEEDLGGHVFRKKSCHLSFTLLYLVPAFLYMVDNNLTFVILKYIKPTTLAVVWNLKILTTTLFFRLILKKSLHQLQYIAVLLLVLGVFTTESDHIKKTSSSSSFSTSSTNSNLATATTLSPSISSDFMIGMLLVCMGVTISSLAGVYTEWILKKPSKLPQGNDFFMQNIQLYLYSILFNGLGMFVLNEHEITEKGFFVGYNHWSIIIICVQVSNGMLVGWIFKYLDNMVSVYSHALSMLLVMLVSIAWFGFQPSLEFGCGFGVCLISIYLYHFPHERILTNDYAHLQQQPTQLM